jgi:hypothetical protein
MVEHDTELARDVGEAAAFWQQRVTRGRRLGTPLGSRYLEMRYETLVSDPAKALAAICTHASLPFDDAILGQMLGYSRHADALLADAAHRSMHTNVAKAPTKGLRDWRRDMSARERALFEAIAGNTLEEFGYPVSSTRSERRVERRNAGYARVRWFVRRRLFMARLQAARWYRSAVSA